MAFSQSRGISTTFSLVSTPIPATLFELDGWNGPPSSLTLRTVHDKQDAHLHLQFDWARGLASLLVYSGLSTSAKI